MPSITDISVIFGAENCWHFFLLVFLSLREENIIDRKGNVMLIDVTTTLFWKEIKCLIPILDVGNMTPY